MSEALGLLSLMGGMGQSAMNTGLGVVPMLLSMWDRLRTRTDPTMNMYSNIIQSRLGQSLNQNPYGDVYGAWGGQFGNDTAGNPVGAGNAAALAAGGMLGQNPAAAAQNNLQQMAGMQRPGVTDTTAGLSALLGRPSEAQPYEQQSFTPQGLDWGQITQGDFSGAQAPPTQHFGAAQDIVQGLQGGAQGLVDALGRGGQLIRQHPLGTGLAAGAGLLGLAGLMRLMRGGKSAGGSSSPSASSSSSRPSYLFGTPFVQSNQTANLHQGEAVLPAWLNPFGKIGAMLGRGRGAQQPLPAGGALGNMAGSMGIPQQDATPTAQPPPSAVANQGNVNPSQSLLQQLFANPMSLDQNAQNMINQQGVNSITNNAAALRRQAYEQAAASGSLGAGSLGTNLRDINLAAQGQGADLRQNTGIQAALQNTNDLRQAAGLQLTAEQALANQQMAQNQLEQGLYQGDVQNQGNLISQLLNSGNQGMGNQLGLWQNILGLMQGGAGFATPFLQSALQNRMYMLAPNAIAQAPSQSTGGTMYLPQQSSGGYGSQQAYNPWQGLASPLGYWAGMS